MRSSMKKHVSHLTDTEFQFLMSRAKKITNWYIGQHAKDVMAERGHLGVEDILQVIKDGDLIEYHLRDNNPRILIRGNTVYYDYVLCVVYDLSNNRVVTLYWNHKDDHHSTINMKNYIEDFDVINTYPQ